MSGNGVTAEETGTGGTGHGGLMTVAWLWVGLPFLYGVYELVQKLTQLFGGGSRSGVTPS